MRARIATGSLLFTLFVSGRSVLAAPEQDYAARFQELQEQKSDAQIEPLLNEWREKKPNDPDAWITSANYYFNQRQVMISTKKPEKGDFGLKNGKIGREHFIRAGQGWRKARGRTSSGRDREVSRPA